MNSLKKIISLLLVFATFLSVLPLSASAVETGVTEYALISVENTYAAGSQTIDVDVTVSGNPGILGATLTFTYSDKLTLVNAVNGEAFSMLPITIPGEFTSPCSFMWSSEEILPEDVADGVILTLTFEVSEDAVKGEKLAVNASYVYGDIIDNDLEPVNVLIANGGIDIIDFIPGDLDDDGVEAATKDIVLAGRYVAGGYDITIVEAAADVNADGRINATDVILMKRYKAGGYGVELKPSLEWCTHELTATAETEATCEADGHIAYWYCGKCDRYYKDANAITVITKADTITPALGHDVVIVPSVSPTEETEGTTEWSYCAREGCGIHFSEPEIIPIPLPDTYTITYEIARNDTYLGQFSIENTNPKTYTENTETFALNDPENIPKGYTFNGWYDSYGTPVKEIRKGSKQNYTLHAEWSKETYHVTFDSPLFPKEREPRTIDQEYYLPQDMQWDHYVFMGWSDASGRIITKVPQGTEDITVHANWTSNRSIAKANDYEKNGPITMYDATEEAYYFVYNIGMLQNVPLKLIEDLGYVNSLGITKEIEYSVSYGMNEASETNKLISNATTKSSSWTLSTDWNELLKTEQSGENTLSKEQVVAVSTGTSYAYNSSGSTYQGASFHTSKDNLTTSKTITDDSYKVSADVTAGVSYGVAKVEASVGTEMAHSTNQEDYSENKTHMSQSGEWNTTNSHSSSAAFNTQSNVSNAIAQTAKDAWSHATEKSCGETESNTSSDENTTIESDEYGYSTSFHKVTEEKKKVTISTGSDVTPGWYRYVLAGDFYVYAVVKYDVATGTFSIHNQSVMADETRKMWDYSKDDSTFNDYNNAVLPFEVPIDVYNYLFDTLSVTEGLEVDIDTGMVTDYTGDAKNVFIPDYYTVENEDDNTVQVVKVTSINSSAFAGKNVELVKLNSFIDTIPNGAFENCASLKRIKYTSLKSIGIKALSGCTSFEGLTVDEGVTYLGDNAFDGVSGEIIINTNSESIVTAALSSTADNMTLNLQELVLSNMTLEPKITGTFRLNAFGNVYSNVSIKSDAETTIVNRVTLKDNTRTPIDLSSKNVTLNQVTIENAPGFAMKLSAEDTVVTLQGKVKFFTNYDNAVICKNITLTKTGNIATELNLNKKNILIYGTLTDVNGYLKDATVKYIEDKQYEDFTTSHNVTFDANGGTVLETQRQVMNDSAIGELPIPTRTGYTFLGWFFANETKITADYVLTGGADVTVYAKWTPTQYTVSWNPETGCTITVNRKSSLNPEASIGKLDSESPVYYGDVLSITYVANGGYSLESYGKTSITVTDNVTEDDIYAFAEAKEYTYKIVYKSSNGTYLGEAEVTYKYDTTNTISAPAINGYITPDKQIVKWDSVTSKTITFIYVPTTVGPTTKSGQVYNNSGSILSYNVKVEYQNRTASSVQLRVVWTSTLNHGYLNNGLEFKASVGSVSTGKVRIINQGTWGSQSSSQRSKTVESGWITVSLNTTNATSVDLSVYHYQINNPGTDISANGWANYSGTWAVAIPAF